MLSGSLGRGEILLDHYSGVAPDTQGWNAMWFFFVCTCVYTYFVYVCLYCVCICFCVCLFVLCVYASVVLLMDRLYSSVCVFVLYVCMLVFCCVYMLVLCVHVCMRYCIYVYGVCLCCMVCVCMLVLCVCTSVWKHQPQALLPRNLETRSLAGLGPGN